MPVDVAPYATLGQGQPNALGMIATFAGAQNQLNQNQLFQQTFRARQALGPLMQQAVGPDGQMDYNKAGLLVSTNPDTAFMAPDILNQFAQKQLIQAETMKTNLDNFAKKQAAIGSAAYALSQEKGDTVAPKDVMSKLTELMAAHGIEAPDAVAYMAGISGLKGPELNSHLKQLAQSSLRGGEMAGNIDYRPDAFHDGNGNPVPGFVNKMQGSAVPSGGVGSPTGAPPSAVSAAPGAGPFQSVGEGGPSVASPPVAPNQPAPTLTQTGVGPQRQAALSDAAAYGKDVNERTNSANQLLLTMQQAQRYLKNFTPGGGEAFRSDLAQLAQAAGMPKGALDAIASGDLSSVQAARKMFFGIGSQIAAQLIHAGGGRMTQTEWGKTLTEGAPNIDLDPGAISKIMTAMRELAHVTNMESDHYRGRMDQASHGFYDMTNVQNDWAKTFGEYLKQREDQPQSPAGFTPTR